MFALDLLTPPSVTQQGWADKIKPKHLPNRVERAGKPRPGADPRRGARVVQMSTDHRLPARAVDTPPPAQRQPGPLQPVPAPIANAARTAASSRRRRAAGAPPPGTTPTR
jgi:hypothetical protein